MTKLNKIRALVIGLLLTAAVGFPVAVAVANAPVKAAVKVVEPVVMEPVTIVLEDMTIYGEVPVVAKPVAKKFKNKIVGVKVENTNRVMYIELEQGGRPGADFVRRTGDFGL